VTTRSLEIAMAAVLTLNAGSSSIKFSVYDDASPPLERASGQVDALGSAAATLALSRDGATSVTDLGPADHAAGVAAILAALASVVGTEGVAAVGHRVVHGGALHDAPVLLDDARVAELERFIPFAPLHQPHNLAAVDAARAAFPDAVQVACFDTAFHRGHPWVNDTFGLPRALYDEGVRRYGFHGLSYDYIAGEMKRIDPAGSRRTVVAHLGNGASMCALLDHRSVGSTMGFSALDGLPMGTRCGQIDPGVLLYLMEQKGMSAGEIADLLYKRSGLKGLSGLSNDMRELEAAGTPEAGQAIDYFVFRIRRELGAMAAILGGLDDLVFCGGIGENSAMIRARVCEGMAWLGIELDAARNAEGKARGLISTGRVDVRVIETDEEIVIARAAIAALRHAAS
jgi:acetate kinase